MINHWWFYLHPLDDVISGEEREFDNIEQQVLALFSVCVCVCVCMDERTQTHNVDRW